MQTVYLIESANGENVGRAYHGIDAQVMIAAPVLLRACKRTVENIRQGYAVDTAEMLATLETAIAIAEKDQP